MAIPVPVPLTGRIDINNIKAAFPSTNRNNLRAYFGKEWYKPSDGTTGTFTNTGPLRDSDFRGKMEAYSFHITADTYNIDMLTEYQRRGFPYVRGQTALICYVDAGVKIGSQSSGRSAFTIQNFAAGDSVVLKNNGSIIGCGGNGGGSAGGDAGGPAITLTYNTRIVNTGTIAGGGGGGGAGAGGSTYGGCCGCGSVNYSGGGGGGGAGFNPGSPNATLLYGGAGQTQNGSTGGPGGNLGQPGTGSTGGGGGAAGKYIIGASFVTGGVGSIGGTLLGPYS